MDTANTIQVDVAIIGAGTAGLVARREALSQGAERVVMIEGGPLGTTCARVGCMPSKLLIAAADAAHGARVAGQFGVHANDLRIDGEAVMRRVQSERDRFAGFVVDATEALPEGQLLRGWARFRDATHLEVALNEGGSVEVEARAVVIATGSAAFIPPPLRDLGDRLLTNEGVFELPTLPRSVAVVGTGVIGLELGQALDRLGVAVQVFDINTRMPMLSDPGMQAEARAIFEAELDLHLGVGELEATRVEAGVQLRWREGEGEGEGREATFDYVLAATGRRPQLSRLGLDAAGVELDHRGMPVRWDERTGQIGDSALFLAGDVTGFRPLLHEAAAEGRIAGGNAARFPEVRAQVRMVPLGIMFTDPNVAVVGTVPTDASEEGVSWEAAEVDFGDQGRARVMGQNRGRARIYASRACGTLIAAELIGPRAEHLAHLLAWTIESKVTAQRATRLPYYHPVVEEGLRTAMRRLARKLEFGPRPEPLDCGPGD